jgi:hypothetical protein
MAVKKIKPANPDTEKTAEAGDTTKSVDRKSAVARPGRRVSGRKTSGFSSGR